MTTEPNFDRIAKLLAKAEATDNPNERETFFAAAQAMATKHSITLEELRQRNRDSHSKSAIGNRPISKTVTVGSAGDRGAGAYSALLVSLARVNGCRSVFSNTEVTMYGMEIDVEQTLALYAVIQVQMVQDCVAYINEGTWRGHTTHTDARRSFYDGYIARIAQRLQVARDRAMREWSREKGASGEMVLVRRDKEVNDWFLSEAPRTREGRLKYRSASMGGKHWASKRAGDAKAQNANMYSSSQIEE